MGAPGTLRRVIGYLLDRSPEILFLGGGGNALITYIFYEFSALRTTFFFLLWAALGAASVFVAHDQDREDRAREPKPWRTLVTLQLLYVAVAWIVLTRS